MKVVKKNISPHEKKLTDLGKRIDIIMNKNSLSKGELARKMGVVAGTITAHLYNEKSNPENIFFKFFSYRFSVNEEWLRTGQGKMERSMDIADIPPESNNSGEDRDMKIAIGRIHRIFQSDAARSLVLRFLEDFENFMDKEMVEKSDFPNGGKGGVT